MASCFKNCPKTKRHLSVKIHDIYLVSFSANPTTNSETTNPNFHEFFDQITMIDLFTILGQFLTKLGDSFLLEIRTSKEGSRIEGTLDFDSYNLGGRF